MNAICVLMLFTNDFTHTAGFHAPHVDSRYKTLATGIGAVAWFWIFYRASQDGAALIVSDNTHRALALY